MDSLSYADINKWARHLNQEHPYVHVGSGKKDYKRAISVRKRMMGFARPTRYNEKKNVVWIGSPKFELLVSLASNACLIEE